MPIYSVHICCALYARMRELLLETNWRCIYSYVWQDGYMCFINISLLLLPAYHMCYGQKMNDWICSANSNAFWISNGSSSIFKIDYTLQTNMNLCPPYIYHWAHHIFFVLLFFTHTPSNMRIIHAQFYHNSFSSYAFSQISLINCFGWQMFNRHFPTNFLWIHKDPSKHRECVWNWINDGCLFAIYAVSGSWLVRISFLWAWKQEVDSWFQHTHKHISHFDVQK